MGQQGEGDKKKEKVLPSKLRGIGGRNSGLFITFISKYPDSDYGTPKAIRSRGAWGHAPPPGNRYILSPQKQNFLDSEYKFPTISVPKVIATFPGTQCNET